MYQVKQIHLTFFSLLGGYCLRKDCLLPCANFFRSDIEEVKENGTACEQLPYLKPETASLQQQTKA